MRNIIIVVTFFLFQISNSQNSNCEIDFTEKTDSTFVKKTKEVLLYERVFGNNSEYVFASLLNVNGVLALNLQYIQKSSDFIKVNCVNTNSKISLQLDNGKAYHLVNNSEDACSELSYDSESKLNIRVLNTYYLFSSENFEDLKTTPFSILRIGFTGEYKDFIIKKNIESETVKLSYKPASYFIDQLKCVED